MLYLDGASTNKVSLLSKVAITEGINAWGNPSSHSELGEKAKSLIRVARQRVANSIGASSDSEIIFTSGGSESNNMAIKGVVFASTKQRKHVITSKVEHKAVLEACRFLERNNLADVTYIDVDENGIVKLEQLEEAINENTVLISIMAINNEVGAAQPIAEVGRIAKKHHVLFHTDAVQAYGKTWINVDYLEVDLLSASGHKIGTPKGIGFLYVREGTKIEPLIHGGGQEFGLRAGTENVPYIHALGVEAAAIDTESYIASIKQNTQRFIEKLKNSFGAEIRFVTNPLSTIGVFEVGFEDIDAVALQAFLDLNGIQVSIGSACNMGNAAPSYVLQSMGIDEKMLNNYLRISVPERITDDEIDYFIKILGLGRKMFSQ